MKKTRIQFDLAKHKIGELEDLMQATDSETRKELFNNAYTLLQWAVEQRQQGYEIASYHRVDKDLHILQMPALNHVVRKKNLDKWDQNDLQERVATVQ